MDHFSNLLVLDSSPPTILGSGFESQACIQLNFVLDLSLCWEQDKNKQKEVGLGPCFKKEWKQPLYQLRHNHCPTNNLNVCQTLFLKDGM